MSVPRIDLKMDGANVLGAAETCDPDAMIRFGKTGTITVIGGETADSISDNPALANLRARAFVSLPRLLEACAEVLRLWESGCGISPGDGTHRHLRAAYLDIAEAAKPKTRAERIEEAAKEIAASRGRFCTPEEQKKGYRAVDADLLDKLMRAVDSEEGGAA